ncbi:hypothetical protein K466DRAFT_590237 [Polyporus arcularius HHB13444]|uniref:Uncharacterized protein n=1 Tax=Polyporus arcularius HHB13444 TaxID=1314778 RepID=A0A5C3P1E7_9APHY|nr:hypothetical protein K466DRAFT_590237 [Polyporus arcularius HHB13444]
MVTAGNEVPSALLWTIWFYCQPQVPSLEVFSVPVVCIGHCRAKDTIDLGSRGLSKLTVRQHIRSDPGGCNGEIFLPMTVEQTSAARLLSDRQRCGGGVRTLPAANLELPHDRFMAARW